MKKKLLLILLGFVVVVGAVMLFASLASLERKDEQIAQWRDYVLYANTSEYEQELFMKLDDEKEEEELATLVFQLFVAQFYSLDFADSSSDVRGVQFVYEPFQEDFEKQARSNVYERVESNFFVRQRAKLPIVTEVAIDEVSESTFLIADGEQEFDSYVFYGEVFYDEDPGYRKEFEGKLIINDYRFDVVYLETYLSE